MKKHNASRIASWLASVVVASAACTTDGPSPAGHRFELYYLGGQSNMVGHGFNDELPGAFRASDEQLVIFHGDPAHDDSTNGGRGRWTILRPGHGAGFSSDGITNDYSDRFGPELSFAHRIRELRPGVGVALIKYARGGSSIDTLSGGDAGSWDPDFGGGDGRNQFDHFVSTVRAALSERDLNGDGVADEIVVAGILWMQGESDGHRAESAAQYGEHLERLVRRIRGELGSDALPIVIGRISDSGRDADGHVWDSGDRIRAEQAEYVALDGNAALVTSTDDYGYSDIWHYDSSGYIDLGRQFAQALDSLLRR